MNCRMDVPKPSCGGDKPLPYKHVSSRMVEMGLIPTHQGS